MSTKNSASKTSTKAAKETKVVKAAKKDETKAAAAPGAFGARAGTAAFEIDRVLAAAKGPMPMKEIAAAVPGIRYHINRVRYLVRKGLATHVKDGYVMVSKVAKAGKKSTKVESGKKAAKAPADAAA